MTEAALASTRNSLSANISDGMGVATSFFSTPPSDTTTADKPPAQVGPKTPSKGGPKAPATVEPVAAEPAIAKAAQRLVGNYGTGILDDKVLRSALRSLLGPKGLKHLESVMHVTSEVEIAGEYVMGHACMTHFCDAESVVFAIGTKTGDLHVGVVSCTQPSLDRSWSTKGFKPPKALTTDVRRAREGKDCFEILGE